MIARYIVSLTALVLSVAIIPSDTTLLAQTSPQQSPDVDVPTLLREMIARQRQEMAARQREGTISRPRVPAQASTTQPSSVDLQKLVDQLADGESEKRERAREALMGISQEDLPALQQVVSKMGDKLIPAQQVALKEIVKQVFLSGVTYETDEQPMPFMGVKWNQGESLLTLEPSDNSDLRPPVGLMVEMRLPGFDAYRMLRDNDIVLGIEGESGERIRDSNTFSLTLASYRPGDAVMLLVMRDDQIISVPVKLARKPLSTLTSELYNWLDDRDSQAELYWKRNFRDAVGDDDVAMVSQREATVLPRIINAGPAVIIDRGGAVFIPPSQDK